MTDKGSAAAAKPYSCNPVWNSATAHLKPLTGLRFVAALLVVLCHGVGTWRPQMIPIPPAPDQLHTFTAVIVEVATQGGGLAVTLFFILSGFILTYTYLQPDGS